MRTRIGGEILAVAAHPVKKVERRWRAETRPAGCTRASLTHCVISSLQFYKRNASLLFDSCEKLSRVSAYFSCSDKITLCVCVRVANTKILLLHTLPKTDEAMVYTKRRVL